MDTWYDLIAPFFSTIGFTMPDFLIFVSFLGGLLFGAADYRIGLMSSLMMFIGLASFFIFYGLDTARVFMVIFGILVVMAISLFLENTKVGGLL